MTQEYRFTEGSPCLEALPVSCKRCLAKEVNLEDSAINYNRGDSLISAHLHVNLFYHCNECQARFVVRGRLSPPELYYGDLSANGEVSDESAETQQIRRESSSALRTGQSIMEPDPAVAATTSMEAVPFE